MDDRVYNRLPMGPDWRFANYLARRHAAGAWDISELARRTGATRQTVYRYLRGLSVPAPDKRREMCRGFGFDDLDKFDQAWTGEPSQPTADLSDIISRIDGANADAPSVPTPASILAAWKSLDDKARLETFIAITDELEREKKAAGEDRRRQARAERARQVTGLGTAGEIRTAASPEREAERGNKPKRGKGT